MIRHPNIFAHRGAKSVAPENTLPAFQTALEMGVNGIELDVHCSKDGDLVVIHNFDVDATTDGQGPVSSFTTAQLAALDAGSHYDATFAGVGIPTLAQVLDTIGDRCAVNIEIKSEDIRTGGDQVEPLLAMIAGRGLYDQVIISSFNPISLIKVRSFGQARCAGPAPRSRPAALPAPGLDDRHHRPPGAASALHGCGRSLHGLGTRTQSRRQHLDGQRPG